MILIPSRKLEFSTPLSPEELSSRFKQNVDLSPGMLVSIFRRKKHEYSGQVTPNGFKVWRNIRGRNSYLPIVSGRFEKSNEGTTLHLRIVVHPSVGIFILIVLFVAGHAAFHHLAGSAVAVILIGVVFHIFMYVIGYQPEEVKAIEWVTRILREKKGENQSVSI